MKVYRIKYPPPQTKPKPVNQPKKPKQATLQP